MSSYIYVMLLITYTGEPKGLPSWQFGDAKACIEKQKEQEELHKNDYILLSACTPKGDKTIGIQITPGMNINVWEPK